MIQLFLCRSDARFLVIFLGIFACEPPSASKTRERDGVRGCPLSRLRLSCAAVPDTTILDLAPVFVPASISPAKGNLKNPGSTVYPIMDIIAKGVEMKESYQ
jgi:hypothetical protein